MLTSNQEVSPLSPSIAWQPGNLSLATPTLVLKDGKPFLVTGSPGGSRIITTTLQVIMNVIDHKLNVAEATIAPRIHHQWEPDYIRAERGISIDTLNILKQKSQKVLIKQSMGRTQTIQITPEGFEGFSDPRNPDGRALGF